MSARAYFFDNSDLDQREPHNSGIPVYPDELEALKVIHRKFEGDFDTQMAELDKYIKDNGYGSRDEIIISKEGLGDEYEATMKAFFGEHIHEDDEIRFVSEGSGYFDFRDKKDRWIRIVAEKGDFVRLPAGIYQRFTLDTNNYMKAIRVYKENPHWECVHRPHGDNNKVRIQYLKDIGL